MFGQRFRGIVLIDQDGVLSWDFFHWFNVKEWIHSLVCPWDSVEHWRVVLRELLVHGCSDRHQHVATFLPMVLYGRENEEDVWRVYRKSSVIKYFLPTANMNWIAPLSNKKIKPKIVLNCVQRSSGTSGGLHESFVQQVKDELLSEQNIQWIEDGFLPRWTLLRELRHWLSILYELTADGNFEHDQCKAKKSNHETSN